MKLKFLAAALLLGGAVAAPAGATVIDFENVPGLASSGIDSLSSLTSYAGFNWSSSDDMALVGSSSFFADNTASYLGLVAGWSLGAIQGGYGAFLGESHNTVSFAAVDGSTFSINSGYFAGLRADGLAGATLGYTALVNGSLVTGSVQLNGTGASSTVAFNLNNVSRFSFTSDGYVSFDNLNVGAVPEPTSAALTGLGIAVLALKRRRAQRNNVAA
ncbi:PEP-CTERM sorting domain-containing protein [Derxia lacustris]|uniref:PEP-CTERM sorting domain-containing protein n=1 Tax=Derxia lacustris TaxID=764842 RepID=UPI000A1786C7|nr:PEP-CTERM sorting domain-containing protein [Derxia lacustris]